MTEDYVNHPSHYTYGGKECIDVIHDTLTSEEYAGYLKGTQIKYVFRHEHKWDPAQDLDKAEWYRSRYAEDFGYILDDDVRDARAYEFAQMQKDGNLSSDRLIGEYITAVGNDDPHICELLLNEMKRNVEEGTDDTMDLSHISEGIEDILNRHNGKYTKIEPSDTEDAPSMTMPEPSRESYISTSTMTDNAKMILDGLRFMACCHADLWENAYSFNYDDETNTLTVKTELKEASWIKVAFVTQATYPVTVSLVYVKPNDWKITVETEH